MCEVGRERKGGKEGWMRQEIAVRREAEAEKESGLISRREEKT